MTRYARHERSALCDTLLRVGPDAPTLCEGWRARELAVHLVVRDRRPDAMAAAFLPPLAGHQARVEAGFADRDWKELVRLIRSGPPGWSPVAVPAVAEKANLGEFFVHHEDLRRVEQGFTPRELAENEQRGLWETLGRTSKLLLRKVPTGVMAEVPARGVRRLCQASGAHGDVTLRGAPGELLLYVFGRGRVADVDVAGADEDLATFRAAHLA